MAMNKPYKITVQQEPNGEWHAFVWTAQSGAMNHGKGKTPAEATLGLMRDLIDKMEWEPLSITDWVAYRPNPNPSKQVVVPPENVAADDERIAKAMMEPTAVYVFEANKLGIHQAGTALTAFAHYGATQGRPDGRQGRAYGVYTMLSPARGEITLGEIKIQVVRLIEYAKTRVESTFVLTRLGAEAGIPAATIATLFKNAPKNMSLPLSWRDAQ